MTAITPRPTTHGPFAALLGLAFTLAAGMAHAAIVASTTFEEYPLGIIAGTAEPFDGDNEIDVQIRDDSYASPFGSNNQWVHLDAIGDSFGYAVGFDTTYSTPTLATYKFDIFEPANITGDTTGQAFGIGDNIDLTPSRGWARWSINNGIVTTTDHITGPSIALNEDHAYTTWVLYNGSGSSQLVENSVAALGGAGLTLAPGDTALVFFSPTTGYQYGLYTQSGGTATSANQFLFRATTGTNNELYIDNMSLTDTLEIEDLQFIPEPGSLPLIFMGAALVNLVRRKVKHTRES